MKKTTKNNSTAKKLLPAFAMLTVSAITLTSATYAWFTLNKDVSVTGMKLKATAEGGIVITNEAGSEWKASALASHDGTYTANSTTATLAVRPTSTEDAAHWYHNISDNINDAKAHQATSAYATLSTTVDSTTGAGYVDTDGTSGYNPAADSNYYLKNTFYIKSSQAEAIDTTTNSLNITKVKATLPGTQGSADLDKAFRVAIVMGGNAYIFAPVEGATLSYYVDGSDTAIANITASHENDGGVTVAATGVTSVPGNSATTANAVKVDVYLYFEGEDANCKSVNLTTSLDEIGVELGFGLSNYPLYQ